jgi:steroid delta-isomerase-like uncharacterized protein
MEAPALKRDSASARLRIVEEHIRLEKAHDLGPLVATFGLNPEFHNKAGDQVLQGHDAIRDFYGDLFRGFPDFWLDVRQRHVAGDSIVVEGVFGGTHTSEWMGIPPRGKSIKVPFCAIFTFTDDDQVKAEIVYYDGLSLLVQLGAITLPA